jgi:hypothetical protein
LNLGVNLDDGGMRNTEKCNRNIGLNFYVLNINSLVSWMKRNYPRSAAISKKRTSYFQKELSISGTMTSEMNNVVSWKLRRKFWYEYVGYNGREKRQYNCTRTHGFTSYYNVHDSPPPLLTLSQTNPFYAILNDLLKILSNILLPSMPISSKWSLSFNSLLKWFFFFWVQFLHWDHSVLSSTCHLFQLLYSV